MGHTVFFRLQNRASVVDTRNVVVHANERARLYENIESVRTLFYVPPVGVGRRERGRRRISGTKR